MNVYDTPHTCRVCGKPMRSRDGVKYAVRHWAHYLCFADGGLPIHKLHPTQALKVRDAVAARKAGEAQ